MAGAPQLEPKERHYVGYKPPHTQIFYELDFSRGAEVDIGCGTTIVGDSIEDKLIPRTLFTHPCSMHALSSSTRRPTPSPAETLGCRPPAI